MALLCPTVLAENPHSFREQLERVEPFARRIQIDLMDGVFAPSQSVELAKIWLPDSIPVDIHLMFQNPDDYLEQLITLKPHMVIVHAESDCDVAQFAVRLNEHDIQCGVAVLPETTVASINDILPYVQHVLIFGGKLGYFGGTADLSQLQKVAEIKSQHSEMEIGWDGGVNEHNALEIAQAGVDVINVGGFIQKSENPEQAYQQLENLVS